MFWSQKKKNKKWQGRRQLYKGRFYYLKRVAQGFLVFSALVGVVSLVLYFKNSEALSIKQVQVLGDLNHITKDQVLILSGIRKTDKLFGVDLGKVQDQIKRFSWIQDVRLRREFPDKIQIHITEREPKALLSTGKMYLVDQKGDVFKSLEPGDPLDLPIITGFKADEFKKYPRLMRTYFEFCFTFLGYLENQEFYKGDPISEVHFDRVAGFTVYTKNAGLEIYYGRDDYMIKQRKLEKFKLSEQYEQMAFVRLDLDSKDKVIARKL